MFAGQIPKNRPVPAETTKPKAAAHNGTAAGMEGNINRLTPEMVDYMASSIVEFVLQRYQRPGFAAAAAAAPG